MKLVVDMNLSSEWVPVLQRAGHDVLHWSTVGDVRAKDAEIMAWANQAGRTVLTHDLDFGTVLALTRGTGPSVVQVRTQDVTPTAWRSRGGGAPPVPARTGSRRGFGGGGITSTRATPAAALIQ